MEMKEDDKNEEKKISALVLLFYGNSDWNCYDLSAGMDVFFIL